MIKKDDFGGWPKARADNEFHVVCNFYMAVENLKVSIGEALTKSSKPAKHQEDGRYE